jgi:hypothetical protein
MPFSMLVLVLAIPATSLLQRNPLFPTAVTDVPTCQAGPRACTTRPRWRLFRQALRFTIIHQTQVGVGQATACAFETTAKPALAKPALSPYSTHTREAD